MTDHTAPTGERLLTRDEVQEYLRVGRDLFYALVKADRFPAPRHLIGKQHRWLLSELEEYVRGLPKARERWWEPERRERKRPAA